MSNTNSSFLKEMGITEWTSREPTPEVVMSNLLSEAPGESLASCAQLPQATEAPRFFWWFIGDQAQGDAQPLFQGIIRVLGLGAHEWSWVKPSEKLTTIMNARRDLPAVAFVFGGSAAQKITGERDALPQLRETVLAINSDGLEEIPVVASFDLLHLLSKPKDKALLWQDLLLAKSVLQSL